MHPDAYRLRVLGVARQEARSGLWGASCHGMLVLDDDCLTYRPWIGDRLLMRMPAEVRHEGNAVAVTRGWRNPDGSIELRGDGWVLEVGRYLRSIEPLLDELRARGFEVMR